MAFAFESLKAKVTELTNTGVAKAKELSEIGKLKVQNVSEQDEIRKAYMAIGKLYYEQYGAEPGEGFEAFCKQISDSQSKIEYNNERIADLKAAGNLSDEDVEDVDVDDNAPEL
jgi:hypothetical protein